MIQPSLINVLTIGASMVIFTFLWTQLAAHLADKPVGQAMATCLAAG